jgi:hypothetical protein
MTHRLCFHLDEHGRPCNRRVMQPFGFCDQHREKPRAQRQYPEAKKAWAAKAKRSQATAGLSSAMEGA